MNVQKQATNSLGMILQFWADISKLAVIALRVSVLYRCEGTTTPASLTRDYLNKP